MFSTGRTGQCMLFHKLFHLFLAPAVNALFQRNIVLCTVILDEFIRPETLMAFPAVHQRIRKTTQMTAGHPGLGIHQNSTVHAHIVGVFHNKFLPPCFFYIILQFHAKIAIVPCIGQAAVNIGSRIYKASRFCQRHNPLQCQCFFHN